MHESDRDPHFIGWLPIPRAFTRVLLPFAVILLLMVAVVAGLLAGKQSSPGNGRWIEDPLTTLVGVISSEPYAALHVRGHAPDSLLETILLVEEGKFGARNRVRNFDGQAVEVTGTILERSGLRMLELAPGDRGIRTASMSPEAIREHRPESVLLGEAILTGEIVDSKCFLAAMKPGIGRTHRGCAILCLRGGIPPLFFTREGGREQLYFLTDQSGAPLSQTFLSRVGERITLKGSLSCPRGSTVPTFAVTSILP